MSFKVGCLLMSIWVVNITSKVRVGTVSYGFVGYLKEKQL